MSKSVFIAEKPSVAREFASALHENFKNNDGYMESEHYLVTWCVGHLVKMSYPESYDPSLKKWSLSTIPFIPSEFKYEVIPQVKQQYAIVKRVLTREDVETIFVCTDSGREGELIYRLVRQMVGVCGKKEKRVWIDSQTEDEIIRGIKTAKDISEYNSLSDSAYLRQQEDYMMGINFSRAMTLVYGNNIARSLSEDRCVIAVGRVMTCVLGMVVTREREIRDFKPTTYYKVIADTERGFSCEWKLSEDSLYSGKSNTYKDVGFLDRGDAEKLVLYHIECGDSVTEENKPPTTFEYDEAIKESVVYGTVIKAEKKKETVKPSLLYNLAELQNECSKIFKISPDETLKIVQDLYEKKLVTYPRTDARVISTAVAKEITKNISGLINAPLVGAYAKDVIDNKRYIGIEKTRNCDDKKITDHYAIIPTGYGIGSLGRMSELERNIYELICRRFLSIFFEPAIYRKNTLVLSIPSGENTETYTANFKSLESKGYLEVATSSFSSSKKKEESTPDDLVSVKKGDKIKINSFNIKESETTPPKRYTSGSMILAMENAGKLIEDEELRAQIKGSGIGTSATRAEILKKLNNINYIKTNSKTQVITPTLKGEAIYEATAISIPQLLSPELTASWEKGLTYVAESEITSDEYMDKLTGFVRRRTEYVKHHNNSQALRVKVEELKKIYSK